jgi:hypothetical protein
VVARRAVGPADLGHGKGHHRQLRQVLVDDIAEPLLTEQLLLAREVPRNGLRTVEEADGARFILAAPLEIRCNHAIERLDILLEERAPEGPEKFLALRQRRARQ